MNIFLLITIIFIVIINIVLLQFSLLIPIDAINVLLYLSLLSV